MFPSYGVSIQFSFDYTGTTPEACTSEGPTRSFMTWRRPSLHPVWTAAGCASGYHFDYEGGVELTYHKTLPYSTIEGDSVRQPDLQHILYDIVVRQTGEIHSAWIATVWICTHIANVVFEPRP